MAAEPVCWLLVELSSLSSVGKRNSIFCQPARRQVVLGRPADVVPGVVHPIRAVRAAWRAAVRTCRNRRQRARQTSATTTTSAWNTHRLQFCVDTKCVMCREDQTQDCREGFTCDRGVCRWPCEDECPDWAGRCLTERNVCVDCRTNNECGGTFPYCVDNFCRECTKDDECTGRFRFCVYNFCRE